MALPLLLYLASGILLSVAIFLFRFTFYRLAEHSVTLLNNLLSDKEEDEKVAEVEKAFAKTLPSLLLFILCMALAVASAILPFIIYKAIAGWETSTPQAGWLEIVALTIGSILPWLFVKKNKNSDYSEISQLFHALILDNYELGKKLFKSQVKDIQGTDQKTVIVSGLARSGTTALCMSLAERGPFKSLDYSNMPFLLAPDLWKKVYNPKETKTKERKHGDKIKIGLSSVEALEEYFFKVFLNDSFIEEKCLRVHELDENTYNNYLKYQQLIAKDEVYLAKNNNLILRLKSLKSFDPNFTAIMLFRDPVTHARSLMKQHQNFCAQQQEDPFVLRYMNWLGHHEFGLGHKVFQLENGLVEGDTNTLDYWLKVWINYYSYLLGIEEGYQLMDYEDFLKQPVAFLQTIAEITQLPISTDDMSSFEKSLNKKCDDCDEAILNEAMNVYNQLQKRKLTIG